MNKYYCDYYKGEELKTVNVNAKNIEKGAKKIFKTNKKKFNELGYVDVYSKEGEEERFNVSNWLDRNGKFVSKPK